MAQLMSTSTASSASTRLRAEACDKGHVPAQLPLPKVVTLICNLVCAVWFWQHSSAQGPSRAKHRNLYQAHFCLQEFRNNISLKKWSILERTCSLSLSVFTFCLADTSGFYQNLSCSHEYRSHLSCSVKLQLDTQDQKVKWQFGRKRTPNFYKDIQ